MFWAGLAVGFFVGGNFGVILMALFKMKKYTIPSDAHQLPTGFDFCVFYFAYFSTSDCISSSRLIISSASTK